MNDKDKLIDTVAIYAGTVTNSLLGFNLGTASSALVKVGINNMIKKKPYNMLIDFMFDENDNLPEPKVFWDAFKEMIDAQPITIANIKFNRNDIEELERLYNER